MFITIVLQNIILKELQKKEVKNKQLEEENKVCASYNCQHSWLLSYYADVEE